MSEAVSALNGARFSGIVQIEDTGLAGMLTLRANFSDDAVRRALKTVGVDFPDARMMAGAVGNGTLWMSPDEALVLCSYKDAPAKSAEIAAALTGLHHLVVNVSDARALIRLTGSDGALRETLAKLSPADLAPGGLPIGEVRRTRLAQVAAAFWFASTDEAYVICFRSVADYVFGLLSTAAENGSEVGYF